MPRKKKPVKDPIEAAWEQAFPEEQVESNEEAELRQIAYEYARRQIEALKLYEPMPEQNRFHHSRCPMRVVRGSNRSGKRSAPTLK